MPLTIGNTNYTPIENDGGIRVIIPVSSETGEPHVYASISFILTVPQSTAVEDLQPLAFAQARSVLEEATLLFPEPTP